jgi:stress-induced morphogen
MFTSSSLSMKRCVGPFITRTVCRRTVSTAACSPSSSSSSLFCNDRSNKKLSQSVKVVSFKQNYCSINKQQQQHRYYRDSSILRMSAADNNITGELIESMKANIKQALEAESVEVMDLSGNGRHVAIKCVSTMFEGKSAVNRQRMVYKAIWMELQDQVHAVNEMVTNTPAEEAKEA